MKRVIFFLVVILAPVSFLLLFTNKTEVEVPPSPVPELAFELPECFLGHCPVYKTFDVDGDQLSESLVIIPTTMNHAAGKLWIIKDGKVIFGSGHHAQIGVEPVEDGNGFILSYSTTLYMEDIIKVGYVYENGAFKEKVINIR